MSETTQTTQTSELGELLADSLGVDAEKLTEESGPHNTAAWTSLKHLELVVTLEEAYGISLSHQDIKASLRSVAAVRAVLAKHGVNA